MIAFDPTGLIWNPALLWLQAVSDGAIGLAYYAISGALVYVAFRRRPLSLGWLIFLIATFLIACGTTHFIATLVLWRPAFALQGLMTALTAAISVFTAILLVPIVPKLLAMPERIQTVTRRLSEFEAKAREAEIELHVSRLTSDMLVNAVADTSLILLDLDGYITSWNTGAERITGYRDNEVVGRHFSIFHTAEDQTACRPALSLAAADRFGVHRSVRPRLRKDGTTFMADVITHPVRDNDGKLLGYAKITRDISEKVAVEREIENTRNELAQAQKMEAIGKLTAGIAHDFNNLLTIILGNIDLIEWKEELNQNIRRKIDAMRAAVDRGATLASRLLAFARKQTLFPTITYANEVIENMSGLLEGALAGRVELKTVLADNLWPIRVDRNQMGTAILNLAVNAVDAMPNGGLLVIETHNSSLTFDDVRHSDQFAPGDYVTICVSDNGTGMSRETLSRACDPFFTTKPVGEGSGLGLSQVYGFARQSGGHLHIVSELGLGTTERIYLPRWNGLGH